MFAWVSLLNEISAQMVAPLIPVLLAIGRVERLPTFTPDLLQWLRSVRPGTDTQC